MSTLAAAHHSLERLERRSGAKALVRIWQRVANSRPLAWTVFLFLYAVPTLVLAHGKLIWDDEFFTLYLSTTPSWSELMRAMSTGADQHPPTFYWLTRLVLETLGGSAIALRLTAIAGVGAMCLCLYEIVARLVNREWGFCAMLLPLGTAYYAYAFEARGYGLELGFVTAALLMWMLAAAGRRRALTVPMLGMALCGAVASHYYGILAVLPLAAGELLRTLVKRRIDWAVWLAFSSAALPLVAFSHLLLTAREYSAHFWSLPQWRSVVSWYPNALGYAILLPFAVSAAAALLRAQSVPRPGLRSYHAAAVAVMAALPPITIVFAKTVTHAYTDRYAIAALPALCILMVAGMARMTRSSGAAAAVWLATLLCFGGMAVRLRGVHRGEVAAIKDTAAFLRQTGDAPIAVADPMNFHKLSFYARRDLARRLTYVADPNASTRRLGFDTVDRGLLDLAPWFPLNVRWLDEWLAERPSFHLWGFVGPWSWMPAELQSLGADIRIDAIVNDYILFAVRDVKKPPAARQPGDPPGRPSLFSRMPAEGEPLCRKYLAAWSCPAID